MVELFTTTSAVIMIVVEDVSYNICDQRFHEFHLREQHPEVRVVRRTLTQIADWGKLGPNKELLVKGDVVSVVYFRSGYNPNQYPSQLEWDARLMMERSRAIKSPTIQYHLAGTKKVQQALAHPLVVEKFLKEPYKVEAVREIFTGLYSLDLEQRISHLAAKQRAVLGPPTVARQVERDRTAKVRLLERPASSVLNYIVFPSHIRTHQDYDPVLSGVVHGSEVRYGIPNPRFWNREGVFWNLRYYVGRHGIIGPKPEDCAISHYSPVGCRINNIICGSLESSDLSGSDKSGPNVLGLLEPEEGFSLNKTGNS
ncbi:hypothetical protein PR048_029451 [Dryococelus australis]|uniref:Glutathione synthetase n=1 Tax=Dryococelus australis TaxID=614101 RepID=A0ABQ9GDF4_9NEOP|nr:hypothetical protein PR048_029451 [Dryococelus australis]